MKSLTFDNGEEFSNHEQFGTEVYFATPYRSNQCGSNEQVNSLMRRRYTKSTGFAAVPEEAIHHLEMTLKSDTEKVVEVSDTL